MVDMTQAIAAKSDQLNSDDLIGGPMTVKISGVKEGSKEQPIIIHYDGDNGKPWKPCKTMCRVLTGAWGKDGSQYVGKYLTLYRDPDVKWAGEAVGGIRVSQMSGIDSPLTLSLTMTRGKKAPWTVHPLKMKDEGKSITDADYQAWVAKMDLADSEDAIKAVGVEIKDVSASYDRASIDKLKSYYKDRLDTIKSNEAPF